MDRKVILLTGATGFLGRNIIKKIDFSKYQLVIVIKRNTVLDDALGNNIEKIIYTDDIFSEPIEWWIEILKGIDTVIHAAWYVNPLDYAHSKENINCLVGSIKLLKSLGKTSVQHFIGIGTCLEYDDCEQPITIYAPTKPTSLYSASKLALYNIIISTNQSRKWIFSWCRLFFLYGEGEKPKRLVPMIRDALSKGESVTIRNGELIRDYLDIKIAAEYILEILEKRQVGVSNICSEKGLSLKELITNLQEVKGKEHLIYYAPNSNSSEKKVIIGVRNLLKA
jgi:nucleoside-diphosphate-sugar epimerase